MNTNFKLFTESEITETYNKFVKKPDHYYSKANERYYQLSGEDKIKYYQVDFPRVASLFDFTDWIKSYGLTNVTSLLSTYKNDYELDFISAENLFVCEYNNGENDLHTLNLDKKDFDFIIFNQTLEHLYNPFICMKNLFDHLKIGGYLYTTVPTINIPHLTPFHFWGITPIGLCMLSKSVGFEIKECGYWGNYEYLGYIFTNGRWPTTDDVKDEHDSINTTDLCQAQTWVLLQKPE